MGGVWWCCSFVPPTGYYPELSNSPAAVHGHLRGEPLYHPYQALSPAVRGVNLRRGARPAVGVVSFYIRKYFPNMKVSELLNRKKVENPVRKIRSEPNDLLGKIILMLPARARRWATIPGTGPHAHTGRRTRE